MPNDLLKIIEDLALWAAENKIETPALEFKDYDIAKLHGYLYSKLNPFDEIVQKLGHSRVFSMKGVEIKFKGVQPGSLEYYQQLGKKHA